MNPGRGKKSDFQPARVTAAVLTFLPNDVGYFADRFDVMRVCIESLLKNTHVPFDLMVFDNGSNQKVVDYLRQLRDSGEIDFLLLSGQNIGKVNALKMMFHSAPGEVIAYCDDDVFFLPGWLERHLAVLDTYPDVGAVTGMYIKSHMREGIASTLRFAERDDVVVEKGNLISREIEQHYIENMGRTWEKYQEEIAGFEDVRMTYQGIQTFASAGHYQFVARKDRIIQALPAAWSMNLMGQMRDLDIAIDNLGLLRVCTEPATIRLLGNQINEEGSKMIREHGITVEAASPVDRPAGWKTRLFRLPWIRKIAYFFYERLFKIINA
jgi:hypothetical protein